MITLHFDNEFPIEWYEVHDSSLKAIAIKPLPSIGLFGRVQLVLAEVSIETRRLVLTSLPRNREQRR